MHLNLPPRVSTCKRDTPSLTTVPSSEAIFQQREYPPTTEKCEKLSVGLAHAHVKWPQRGHSQLSLIGNESVCNFGRTSHTHMIREKKRISIFHCERFQKEKSVFSSTFGKVLDLKSGGDFVVGSFQTNIAPFEVLTNRTSTFNLARVTHNKLKRPVTKTKLVLRCWRISLFLLVGFVITLSLSSAKTAPITTQPDYAFSAAVAATNIMFRFFPGEYQTEFFHLYSSLRSVQQFPIAPIISVASALEVQLVNGVSLFEGTLMVRPNASAPWGTVCSSGFKEEREYTAMSPPSLSKIKLSGVSVVCGQLGLEPSLTALTVQSTFNTSTPIWIDNANCTILPPVSSTTSTVDDLSFDGNCIFDLLYFSNESAQETPCTHQRDVSVQCVPTPHRFEFKFFSRRFSSDVEANTSHLTAGLVLMRPSPMFPWGTIAASRFVTDQWPRVLLCKALGLNSPSAQVIPDPTLVAIHGNPKPVSSHPRYLTVNYCREDAEFRNCSFAPLKSEYDTTTPVLGLNCESDEVPLDITEVKLVNGHANWNGQILVRNTSLMGNSTPWHFVVAGALLVIPSSFPTQFSDVKNVSQNTNALRALCAAAGFPNASSPSFRFVGASPSLHDADSSKISRLRYKKLVCAGPSLVSCRAYLGELTNNDDYGGFHLPSKLWPSGVDCFPEITAPSTTVNPPVWSFRLENGTKFLTHGNGTKTPINGIVQMRILPDSPWGTVVDSLRNNFALWEAVCAAVGFSPTTASVRAVKLKDIFGTVNPFDYRLTAPIYIGNVRCPQRPRFFFGDPPAAYLPPNIQRDCHYDPILSNSFDFRLAKDDQGFDILAVDCNTSSHLSVGRPLDTTSNYDRIKYYFDPASSNANDRTPYGRVHVDIEDKEQDKSPVCSSDPNFFSIACRKIGYPYVNVSLHFGSFSVGTQRSVLANITCPQSSVDRETLQGCSYDHLEANVCERWEQPLVDCFSPPSSDKWEVRLNNNANGPLNNQQSVTRGRVEFRPSTAYPWGTIESIGFTTPRSTPPSAAILICRKLGYDDISRVRVLPSFFFGAGEGPIWISFSFGDDPCDHTVMTDPIRPLDCLSHLIGTSIKSHVSDLAVDCNASIPIPETLEALEFDYIELQADIYQITVRNISSEASSFSSSWRKIRVRVEDVSRNEIAAAACRTIGRYDPSAYMTIQTHTDEFDVPNAFTISSCTARDFSLSTCRFIWNSYLSDDHDVYEAQDLVVNCRTPQPKSWRNATFWLNSTQRENKSYVGQLSVMTSESSLYRIIYELGGHVRHAETLALCREIGFYYPLHQVGWGVTHPYRMYSSGTDNNPYPNPEQERQLVLSKIGCSGNLNERLSSCAIEINPPLAWQSKGAVVLDCSAEIYNLSLAEFRLNTSDYWSASGSIGRMEMRPNSTAAWGTMYESQQASLPKTILDIACRTVGAFGPTEYVTVSSRSSTSVSKLNAAKTPIYSFDWNCPPNATHLRDCSSGLDPLTDRDMTFKSITQFYAQEHSNDLIINCNDAPNLKNKSWQMRLVGGGKSLESNHSSPRGRLEIIPFACAEDGASKSGKCQKLKWGTLCRLPFESWTTETIRSACRSLGFGWESFNRDSKVVSSSQFLVDSKEFFQPDKNVPIWGQSINCGATEIRTDEQWRASVENSGELLYLHNCSLPRPAPSPQLGAISFFSDAPRSPQCLTHDNDIALDCEPKEFYPIKKFEYRAIRVYPYAPNIVRFEVRPNVASPWGTVFFERKMTRLDHLGQFHTNSTLLRMVCALAGFDTSNTTVDIFRGDIPPTGPAMAPAPDFAGGNDNIWIGGMECPLSASSIYDCTFDRYLFDYFPNNPSNHKQDLVVDCACAQQYRNPRLMTVPLFPPSRWEYRISDGVIWGTKTKATFDGTRSGFGRLEVRPAPWSPWGSVSSTGFTFGLARAACRSAGFVNPDPVDAQFHPSNMQNINQSPEIINGYQWARWSENGCNRTSTTASSPSYAGKDQIMFLHNCSSDAIYFIATPMREKSEASVLLECYPKIDVRLFDTEKGVAHSRSSLLTTIQNISGVVQIKAGKLRSISSLYNYDTDENTHVGWGTLCSDDFDRNILAQNAICRHLTERTFAYLPPKARKTLRAVYTQDFSVRGGVTTTAKWKNVNMLESTTQVVLDDLRCGMSSKGSTTESLSVSDVFEMGKGCTHRSLGETNCVHREDAGLYCLFEIPAAGSSETPSIAISSSHTEYSTHTESLVVYRGSVSTDFSDSRTLAVSSSFTHVIPAPLVLTQAVPEAVTTAVTTVAIAVGGASAAVDAQALAIIGLVNCGKGNEDKLSEDPKGYRSLSIAALDDSCEGVVKGNLIVLSSVAVLSVLATVAVKLWSGRRSAKPLPLKSAMAKVKTPSILISLCTLFLNSFAVCGTILLRRADDPFASLSHIVVGGGGGTIGSGEDVALGAVSWVLAILIVVSFPLLAYLFASRTLQLVKYDWEATHIRRLSLLILPQTQLDTAFPSANAFGSIVSAYRRLSPLWTLTSLASFFAAVPLILAQRESCVPLFSVSACLYISFGVIVLITRPRRTLMGDILHSFTLIANGALMGVSAGLLHAPGTRVLEVATIGIGYTLTFSTAVRVSLSLVMIAVKQLSQRGVIQGISVVSESDVIEYLNSNVWFIIPDWPCWWTHFIKHGSKKKREKIVLSQIDPSLVDSDVELLDLEQRGVASEDHLINQQVGNLLDVPLLMNLSTDVDAKKIASSSPVNSQNQEQRRNRLSHRPAIKGEVSVNHTSLAYLSRLWPLEADSEASETIAPLLTSLHDLSTMPLQIHVPVTEDNERRYMNDAKETTCKNEIPIVNSDDEKQTKPQRAEMKTNRSESEEGKLTKSKENLGDKAPQPNSGSRQSSFFRGEQGSLDEQDQIFISNLQLSQKRERSRLRLNSVPYTFADMTSSGAQRSIYDDSGLLFAQIELEQRDKHVRGSADAGSDKSLKHV